MKDKSLKILLVMGSAAAPVPNSAIFKDNIYESLITLGHEVTIKISTQSMGNHFHIKNESVVFVNYRDWSPQTPWSLNTGLDWATITQM